MGAREISTLHEIKRHGDQGHHRGSHSGNETWFKRGKLPLSSSAWENKLLYSSASDTMAVKHNTKNANAKNAVKVAAPVPLAGVYKFLEAAQYLALVGGLVKVDGYVCQEEAQDKVVNVQA